MKKVISWTAYILAVCLLIAYTISGVVSPEFTKHITDVVIEWLNTPICIAGFSITISGIVSFVLTKFVFNNTKFGRKELDNIKNADNEFKNQIIEYKNEINEQINEYKENFNNLEQECENKVTVLYDEFSDLQTTLLNSLKTIPNKKIKKFVEDYEKEFEIRKSEIIEKTIDTNKYIDEKINEIKAQYEVAFNELVKKVESVLNEEGKETINSETIEE